MRCIRATRRPLGIAPLLLGLSLAGGCGTSAPHSVPPVAVPAAETPQHDRVLQAAVTRWNRCVERQVNVEPALANGKAQRFTRLIQQRSLAACEGHRRDIAQRFPRHLEARVHETLAERERTQGLASGTAAGRDDRLIEAIDSIFPNL